MLESETNDRPANSCQPLAARLPANSASLGMSTPEACPYVAEKEVERH